MWGVCARDICSAQLPDARLIYSANRTMTINWKEISKFVAGAFFVSAGTLFYLYITNTPVPIIGTHYIVQPEVNGIRSIIHTILFVVCFCFGFIRR